MLHVVKKTGGSAYQRRKAMWRIENHGDVEKSAKKANIDGVAENNVQLRNRRQRKRSGVKHRQQSSKNIIAQGVRRARAAPARAKMKIWRRRNGNMASKVAKNQWLWQLLTWRANACL
jgi:hypothetical protein